MARVVALMTRIKRRRRRRKEPEAELKGLPAIDPGERRWQRNVLVKRTNVTATPLDAYFHAGFLDRALFEAGDELRNIWHRAGRHPRLTGDLELMTHGSQGLTDAQAHAWAELVTMIAPLMPVHRSVACDVCCYEQGAEQAAANRGQPAHLGVLILRNALSELCEKKMRKRRKRQKP